LPAKSTGKALQQSFKEVEGLWRRLTTQQLRHRVPKVHGKTFDLGSFIQGQ